MRDNLGKVLAEVFGTRSNAREIVTVVILHTEFKWGKLDSDRFRERT